MFETIVWWLVVGFFVVTAAGFASYFLVRWAFIRIATRMSRLIERQVGAATAQAFARLGKYGAAAGIGLVEADRRVGRHIDRLARLMDSAIRLPVLGPVGFDAVLGLVPVVGDVVGAA